MNNSTRIQLAVIVLLADFLVFFLPLGAALLAFVLIARPAWFIRLVNQVYEIKE